MTGRKRVVEPGEVPPGQRSAELLQEIADSLGVGVDAFVECTAAGILREMTDDNRTLLLYKLVRAFDALRANENRLEIVRLAENLVDQEQQSTR